MRKLFLPPKQNLSQNQVIKITSLIILLFFLVTLLQDFVRSAIHHSAYYFTESLLFSTFWLIFIPLLCIQLKFILRQKKISVWKGVALIFFPVLAHTIIYPLVVWVLSAVFYDHTFIISQTLRYTLSEQIYLLLIFYGLPVFLNVFKKKITTFAIRKVTQKDLPLSLFVTEQNRQSKIYLAEIMFIKANTPYLNIHLDHRKYLHKEPLRSFLSKLNNDQFLQIHRSTIINIKEVQSFASRHNGDYDLCMNDGTVLRLSRNYVQQFRKLYYSTPQVSA